MSDLIPTNEEVKAIEVMAKQAVESKYVEKLGGYAGVFSIAMYARELNVPIMSALFGGMSNIMGKITIAPQLMNAMIRKAGHKLKIDSNDQRCIIEGTRKDTGEVCIVSFSVEEARKAGLVKPNGGWEKYPSDMCFARALSRLARRLFPDVIGMAYVEGEIDEKDDIKEEQEKSSDPITVSVQEPTAEEFEAAFKLKFKDIENMDFDLKEYVAAVAKKLQKTEDVIIKEALKNSERFSETYLKWVANKNAVEEAQRATQTDLLQVR